MRLSGPWVTGFVLDYHSVSAIPTADPYHFEMKYTELGERLFRFKYRGDKTGLPDLVDTAEDFLRRSGWKIDCIVPAPPSTGRTSQPVVELARELAKRVGIPVCEAALTKVKKTLSIKNIPDWLERQKVLGEAIQGGTDDVKGKSVLILDDIVESGSTLRRAAEVVVKDGKAASAYALALTRTR
jgi:competence protein ComFC